MFQKARDKQAYKIYRKILYHPQYQEQAKAYREALNVLQAAAQTFTPEQWNAVIAYKEAFWQLHQTAMQIAIHKKHNAFSSGKGGALGANALQ